MSVQQPQSSNRGKGQTREDAFRAMQSLPEEVLEKLGPGGQRALARICEVAPGTFFHSQDIAELLPEPWQLPEYVSATLLHDLGKVHFPDQYAENIDGESKRPPVDILHAHVDGGKTLADYYALSPLARDAIYEHHGTMPTLGATMPYRGREPRSMFTAVLMMTDKIEAIKSGGKLSEELIWKVYDECKMLGQFDHVDEGQLRIYVGDVLAHAQEIELEMEVEQVRPLLDEIDSMAEHVPSGPALQGVEELGYKPFDNTVER